MAENRSFAGLGLCCACHDSRNYHSCSWHQNWVFLFLFACTKLNVVYLIIGIFYVAVVSYANVYMCLETKRHKKRIQNEQVTYEEARKAKKDRRSTTTVAMVLAALVFTTCPSQMFLWKAISDSAMEPNARIILWKWTITSLLFRSLHNPIIYCWRVRKMRRAFLEVLNLQTWTGADPGFFFGGGAPFKNDVTDWWRKQIFIQISVVLEIRRSPQGGGGAYPLHPPPRSVPVECTLRLCSIRCVTLHFRYRRGAAPLPHRNRAEITVLMRQQKNCRIW